MAANIDIQLRRNEDWARGWQMVAPETGDPIDITDWSIEMQVKSRLDNTTVVQSAICTINSAALGMFTTMLRASEGFPLHSYGDAIQSENLPYDIRLTTPSGIKIDVAFGLVVLSRGVTLSG